MPLDFIATWLIESDQAAWLAFNKQSHYNLFTAFLAFNLVSFVAGKWPARGFTSPKLAAQGKHGICQFLHATAAVAAATYLLTHRPSPLRSGCDNGNGLFCFDRLTFLLLDIHAGYLFYEWIFYLINDSILKPRFHFLRLHRTLLLAGYALAKVHPCTLTVIVLPLYQLLTVAQIAEARLDLAVAFGKPTRICLDRLWYLVFLSFFRAIGALAISFYSWWWISSRDLIHLDTPPGKRSVLNAAYCYIIVGGSFLLALLYLNWFRAAGDSQKRTYAALEAANRSTTTDTAQEKLKESSGPAKKKKKRAS